MAVEKIVTLCKEGDSTQEYYPNIKADNIPVNSVAKTKLATELQNEIDAKAPQSTTYTKTEVDNKLSGKVNVATYNAKVSELETSIGTKANASDVYTKTETDTLLGAKANSNDVYNKTQVYTKTETDTLLGVKANQSTTYTKTEVDTILSNGYYNQSQIDDIVEDLQDNISDNYYAKDETYNDAEIDTLLSAKADKSTTYTKTETDTLLNARLSSDIRVLQETISGTIQNVETITPYTIIKRGNYYYKLDEDDGEEYYFRNISLYDDGFLTNMYLTINKITGNYVYNEYVYELQIS